MLIFKEPNRGNYGYPKTPPFKGTYGSPKTPPFREGRMDLGKRDEKGTKKGRKRDEKGMKNKGLIWVGYSFQRRGHRGTLVPLYFVDNHTTSFR